MKSLLLFTSDKVGFTGEVSWNFIFQDDKFKAFETYPKHMASPYWGMFKEVNDNAQSGFNIFETGAGVHMSGPITENNKERNQKIVDSWPEYFYMLCTTATAKFLEENLKDMGVSIITLHSDKVLTSSN